MKKHTRKITTAHLFLFQSEARFAVQQVNLLSLFAFERTLGIASIFMMLN